MDNKAISLQRRMLALLCTVQFMSLLDTSIVQVALPSIQQDLGMPASQLQWIGTSYAVCCGGFLLLGGRLGDLLGRRRMLIFGMTIFTLASALAGLALDGMILILSRALQGIGAAFMLPAVISLISLIYAEGEGRNRALGLLGTVAAIGFTSGLILGGLLTDTLGWRFIFFVNIPIGLIILISSPRILPESIKVRQPVDFLGAITITGALVVFLYALSISSNEGSQSMHIFVLYCVATLLLILFILIERFSPFPLVPFRIFSERAFVGAITASLVFGAVMGSSIYMLNLYLQNVFGYRPLSAGMAFLPQELLTMISASFMARLVSKLGLRMVLSLGMLSFAVGLFLLSMITAASNYMLEVLPGTLFIGLGAAMVLVSGSIAATAGIQSDQQGLASGLWNTGPQLGTALGIAVVLAIASFNASEIEPQSAESPGTIMGYGFAFKAALVFTAVGLCSSLLLIRSSKPSSLFRPQPENRSS